MNNFNLHEYLLSKGYSIDSEIESTIQIYRKSDFYVCVYIKNFKKYAMTFEIKNRTIIRTEFVSDSESFYEEVLKQFEDVQA